MYIKKWVYKQMLPRDAARKDKCMKLQTNQSMQQTRRELQYIVIIVAVFCRILPSGPPSRYRWCNDKETLWTLDTCRTARIYELHRIARQHAQKRSISLLSISFLSLSGDWSIGHGFSCIMMKTAWCPLALPRSDECVCVDCVNERHYRSYSIEESEAVVTMMCTGQCVGATVTLSTITLH